MSRTSRVSRRLRLFALGNDRCPICLTRFTELDVEKGEIVTLEHVPPKSFNAGGFAMCLTCADCNSATSRVEQAAVEAKRYPKARLDIPGLPTQTAYLSRDEGQTIEIRTKKPRVSPEALNEALRLGRSIRLQVRIPEEHYASVPWLKAAYLSVFSILGVHGYRYAAGKAIQQVRNQITRPGETIVHHFAFAAPPEWKGRDGIAMSREGTPCWAVKMGDCVVLLPRSWDTSFYGVDRGSPLLDAKLELGGGPLWYPARFGSRHVASVGFAEGYDPRKELGEGFFGMRGRVTQGGRVTPFVFADSDGKHATVLITRGLSED